MGSKLDHLLTSLAQPQALQAPYSGKGDVKEVENDIEECNNRTCRGITCDCGFLVSALYHYQLRYISSPGGNMI